MKFHIDYKIVIADFLVIFSTATLFALHWARENYPMQSALTVFFVVHSDTAGHDSGTAVSFFKNIIVPTLLIFCFLFAMQRVLQKFGVPMPNRDVYIGISLGYFVLAFMITIVLLRAWEYPKIEYEVHKKPEYSDFYAKNYISPDSRHIVFPEKKRNLVIVFMESMESTFSSAQEGGVFQQNLIPGLTELAKENVNFSGNEKLGGGVNLEGTSWTVAGLISKMGAVPYFYPFKKVKGGRKICLPDVVTLGDVLDSAGYTQVFSMGSEKQFENRDTFLENHGMTIHDITWYKAHGYIPKDYQVFWGFEDAKLFEIARKELSELGESGKPFCYGMLTVDTHFPDGYKCPDCPSVFDRQIMNVIRCSDTKITSLVRWMQTQSWYENTTVVILGDHCYLNAPKSNFIDDESIVQNPENQRRFLDVIINPAVKVSESVQKNRQFSSFDVLPTVLECLGCKVQDGGIAFGRSLLSGQKTIVEQYGEEKVNSELMKRTVQYESLKE